MAESYVQRWARENAERAEQAEQEKVVKQNDAGKVEGDKGIRRRVRGEQSGKNKDCGTKGKNRRKLQNSSGEDPKA